MIRYPDADHQPLSWLAKPQLCGQCWLLWGEEGHGKKKRGSISLKALRP
nr:MAG TPA: hypothetical protein [Caudoviricetes sp.]